jgi:hypothetical protein
MQGERRRRGICRSWLHTFCSFSTPRSLFDCLEKRYAELDQLCNPKPNSAAMRSLLRCKHEVGVAGV